MLKFFVKSLVLKEKSVILKARFSIVDKLSIFLLTIESAKIRKFYWQMKLLKFFVKSLVLREKMLSK